MNILSNIKNFIDFKLGLPYNKFKFSKGSLTMLTTGLEDYLELIYKTILDNKEIKAIDIANEFNISRPSVSEALIRLADMDLIVYEGRKGIKITQKGIDEAKKIINKHNVLLKFFNQVLEIDYSIANKNACKIEHVIDDFVLEKIKNFSEFCIENNIYKEKNND